MLLKDEQLIAKYRAHAKSNMRVFKDFLPGWTGVVEIGVSFQSAHPLIELHEHNSKSMEIGYLSSGLQTYTVAGTLFNMRPGDAMIVKPGQTHSSAGRRAQKGTFHWIKLQAPLKCKSLLGFRGEYATRLTAALHGISVPRFRVSRVTGEHFDRVIDMIGTENSSGRDELAILLEVVALISEIIRGGTQSSITGHDSLEQRVRAYALKHIEEAIDIGCIADFLGLSRSWFKRKFRLETSLSPFDFVMRIKMEIAELRLLNEPDMNVTQLALSLGFSTSQHFATVFKRYAGMTPLEVRACRDL